MRAFNVIPSVLMICLLLVPHAALAQGAPATTEPLDLTIQIGNAAPITFSPTLVKNLSRAFIKLTGVDLSDDKLIDDFSTINNCDMFTKYYRDEFNWRQVREAFRRVIQRDLETYPEHFYLVSVSQLGRYDFEKKAFIFGPQHKMQRVGLMSAAQNINCAGHVIDRIPMDYNFRLTNPVTLDSIPMEEGRARKLITLMEQSGNPNRTVYLTFYLRANDFSTMGGGTGRAARATVRATMLSLRFFLDADRKIMIYEYTGSPTSNGK